MESLLATPMSPSPDKVCDITINGRRYRVLEVLNRTNNGILFLCRYGLGKKCVLKKLNRCFDEEDERAFFREYQVLRSLNHPNIVKAIDFGKEADTGFFFLVMEYIQGRNLRQQVQESIEGAIFDYFHQTLQACDNISAKGIVHCDIKLENILVTCRNRVKLIDFGEACREGERMRAFSAPFLAPEHLSDPDKALATKATDLYALGVSFYWLLTGTHPYYPGDKLGSYQIGYFEKEPVAATGLNSTINPRWDELLMGLIDIHPEKRLESAINIVQQTGPG